MDCEKKRFDEIFDKVNEKLIATAKRTMGKLPYIAVDGVYNDFSKKEVTWWTNGFWGGLMWLMYSEMKNPVYKEAALDSEKLLDKAFCNFRSLHHDVGFMWYILSGANFKLTGDLSAENKTLIAAAMLYSRYNTEGKFIQAWDFPGTKGYSIIDSMMNIPLLYFAAKQLDNERYMNHADMVIRDHIRDDGSVRHIVEHDVKNGEIIKVHGGQGYDSESCWTRGSAWAVYGMILSYIHTGEKRYYDTAVKVADFFIENAKKTDYKIPVDFLSPKEPVYYDSTASACAACGLLEIAKHSEGEKSDYYYDNALKLIGVLDRDFCDYDKNRASILQMGTERYPHESMHGVHVPIIYGDFFYIESLLKIRGNKFLIW